MSYLPSEIKITTAVILVEVSKEKTTRPRRDRLLRQPGRIGYCEDLYNLEFSFMLLDTANTNKNNFAEWFSSRYSLSVAEISLTAVCLTREKSFMIKLIV